MSIYKILSVCLCVLLVSGCAVGPNFIRPENGLADVSLEPPDNRELSTPVTTDIVPNAWWTLFADPILNSLQVRASESNLDLMAAYTRIDQSRANLGIATAGLLPAAQVDAAYNRQGLSANGPMAALGAPTSATSLWQTGLTAIWEIDLWGKNRRIREKSMARSLSTVYAKELVHVALSAEVANTYILLRGMQSQLDIARRNESIARDSLARVQTRLSNGVATSYDVATAKSELAQVSALVVEYSHQCDVLMNSLALLLAMPPGSLVNELQEHKAVPLLPETVPVGLPSELARRRPDIYQAEKNLHAATASIGVAKASFYPSITLSGSLGLQAFERNDLGFWDSRWFNVGPSVYLPLFQGGRLVKELELREAEQAQAALEYRKTVLAAWHEIDNSLRLFASEQKRFKQLQLSFEESKRAFSKVKRSYQEGEASYLEMLTAQRNILARESALQAVVTQRAAALVALYKAVGGGWDDEQLIRTTD